MIDPIKSDSVKSDPLKSDPLQSAPLAYQNETFLNSPDGRVLRILAEYQERFRYSRRPGRNASKTAKS